MLNRGFIKLIVIGRLLTSSNTMAIDSQSEYNVSPWQPDLIAVTDNARTSTCISVFDIEVA